MEFFFEDLEKLKKSLKKVKHIEFYGEKKPKKYLINHTFDNEMCSLLHNLRLQFVDGSRDNFHSQCGQIPPCRLCGTESDSQQQDLFVMAY